MHTRGTAYEVGMPAVTCADTSIAASLTSTGCSKQAESCKQMQKARANDQHSKQSSSAPASASPAVTQALLAHSICPNCSSSSCGVGSASPKLQQLSNKPAYTTQVDALHTWQQPQHWKREYTSTCNAVHLSRSTHAHLVHTKPDLGFSVKTASPHQ